MKISSSIRISFLALMSIVSVLVPASAQTCTLTVPATFVGWTGQQYSISYSGLTAPPYKVQYITDAYGNFNPGLGAGSERGISLGPTSGSTAFVLPINSSWNANGPRLVTANVYDIFGTLLASCTATGTSANTWPVVAGPTLSVVTSTSTSSPWTGAVTITPTITNTTHKACYYSVDGLITTQENTASDCTARPGTIYTANWDNNPHNVCLSVIDDAGGLTHTPGYEGEAGEFCRQVTFSNGTTPMAADLNSDKVYLAAGGTFTLTASTLNTDGTTSAGSPVGVPQFLSGNTAIATVNQTTGVITGVASGSTYIQTFLPIVHGTDLTTVNTGGNATSVANPFNVGEGPLNGSNNQWGCYISAGTGFTVGLYTINAVQYLGGTSPRIYGASMPGLPTYPPGASGATYDCGPIAYTWVFVWPTNTMPYIGSDASINTSYNTSNAAVLHGIFAGSNILTNQQPYYFQGQTPGTTYEFNKKGKWWAFEFGAGCLSGCSFTDTIPTAGAAYTTWQSALNSSISTNTGYLNSQPNLYIYLNWSNITGSSINTYGASSGPGASLSPPALQYMIQQYTATGKVLGGYWHDESPQGCPGCGPIVFDPAGTGTGQTWLISIAATGGGGVGEVCGVTTGPNGSAIYGPFIVHGSATSAFNSVYPNTYSAVAGAPGNFHFTCPNVPDGTYNNGNDPGFTLEPLANGWVNSSGAYVTSNAWALMRSQINAVTGHFGFSGTPIGSTINAIYTNGVCNVDSVSNNFRNYGGWSKYTNGGQQPGDYSDIYMTDGGVGFLTAHANMNMNLNGGGWIGSTLRILYGCGYSPDLPMNALTEGTLNYYGTKGYPVTLTSAVGNLLTFSAPHGITNIIPGISRLYVTGATDVSSPQDSTNNNFVLVDCPTTITCHVDLAATTAANNSGFSGSNSGTITFQDGSTQATTGISATGAQNNLSNGIGTITMVDQMRWGTIPNATNILRKRGQTFSFNGTCSGTGCTFFNANTFRTAPDWLNVTTAPSTVSFYRQLPILNSTGGTAFIIVNQSYIKGLSASTGPRGPTGTGSGSGDIDPEWMHANKRECIYLRCGGERIYQISVYQNGYSDQTGLTVPGAFLVQWGPLVFNDNHAYQITVSPHFENGAAVPAFMSHVFTAMDWNANVKYWQQPRLNSPSINKPSEIDCGAAAGSYGNILGCTNMTNGPRTITIPTTPYLQSGQNWIWYTSDAYGIGPMNIVNAGTSTLAVTLDHGQSVNLKFPVTFAGELAQPHVALRLADVPNATHIGAQCAYDPYYLDIAPAIDMGAGSGGVISATLPFDLNIGTVYCKFPYLNAGNKVLSTGAIQTF